MPAPRIPRTLARNKPEPNLRRRVQHLAFVRQLPCVACGKAAPSHTAHVRTGTAWWRRDEAGRSLCRSTVHRLPCETASGWRAYLLVRASHRSSQRGFATVDCVGRCRGRGAHCLSGATTDQSGEGISLTVAPQTVLDREAYGRQHGCDFVSVMPTTPMVQRQLRPAFRPRFGSPAREDRCRVRDARDTLVVWDNERRLAIRQRRSDIMISYRKAYHGSVGGSKPRR